LLAAVLILAVVPVVLSAVRADPPTLDELGDPTEGRLAYSELLRGRDTTAHLDPEGGSEVYLPLDEYGLNNARHAEYRGGVLVFASELGSGDEFRREIFALTDGAIVQLTTDDTLNQRPSVSPDGQWVAYESLDAEVGNWRIRLVRTDGTDNHALAAVPDGATWPTWSPGSDAIAYASQNRIFRVQAFDEAAEPIQLTDIYSGEPAWSDAGDGGAWIAFSGYPGEGPREVMEIPDQLCEFEGSEYICDPYRTLYEEGWEEDAYEPAYTPNGIAFTSDSGEYTSVYHYVPGGGGDVSVTATFDLVSTGLRWSAHPTWRDDVEAVAYGTELEQGRIWTSLPDGTDPVRHSEPLPYTLDDEPAYSPDGRRLAYDTWTTDEFGQDLGGAIRIDDLDDPTAAPVVLEPDQYEYYLNPAFSPDGRYLAVEHWFEYPPPEVSELSSYISEIVVLDLDDPTAPVRRLPHAETVDESADLYASVDTGPSWSPDGTQLVFARSWEFYGYAGEFEEYPPLPYATWANYLHVTDAEFAAEPRRITSGTDEDYSWDWGPAWSPVDEGHIVFSRDSDLWSVDPSDCDGPAEDPCANAAVALAGDLADMDLSSPAFSPDGTRLAVAAGIEYNPALAAAVQPLAIGPVYSQTEIWTLLASGGEGTQVSADSDSYRSYDSPAWQPTADMALHIEPDPATVLLGDESTVTLTVSNLGRAASAATVAITLPAGLTLVTAPANCAADGTSCEVESMATRTQTQIELVVRGDVLGEQPIDAVVTPRAVDPDPSNNAAATSITVDPRPDEPSTPPPTTPPPGSARLRIAADVEPAPGYVGGANLVVTFTVTNTAPAPATSVQLTVTLPEELPVVDAPAGCTAGTPCDIGTLPSGTSIDVVFTLSPDAAIDDVVAGTAATEGAAPATDDAPIIVLQPSIEVNPGLGPPGRPAHVTGEDFPPGAHVAISLDGGLNTQSTEVVIAADGTFGTSLMVLVHEQLGPREILAEPVSGPTFGPVDTPFLVVPGGLDPPDFIGRR
jgi:Tol biopolymer transport system component